LQELSQHHDHIWLVEMRPWETDPKAMVKVALETRYNVVEHKAYPGANIYAYRLN
jgi:hypothetical protein